MLRIAGADVDADLFGAGKDGFQESDPGVSGATVVTEDWLNQIQEEIVRAIEEAGLTPDATYQLGAAVRAIVADSGPQNLITTSNITSDQDHYAPTGWSTASVVRLVATGGARIISGLLGTATVKQKLLINAGAQDITLAHLSSATASDHIDNANNVDFLLNPDQAVLVQYDSASSKWRIVCADLRSVIGSLLMSNNISAGGEFLHSGTHTRTGVMIPLAPMRAHADWTTNGGGDNDYLIVAAASGQQILFDVRLPNGAVVSEVRAGVRRGAGGSGDINLNVYSVAHDTGAAPGASVASLLGNDATSGTSAVADRLAVSGLSSFTQGVANMLRVEINASSSGAEDRLYWLSVTFTDPGPRNY